MACGESHRCPVVRRRLMIDDPRSTCTMTVSSRGASHRPDNPLHPANLPPSAHAISPLFPPFTMFTTIYRDRPYSSPRERRISIDRFLFNNDSTRPFLEDHVLSADRKSRSFAGREQQHMFERIEATALAVRKNSVWKFVSRTGLCLKSQRDTDSFFFYDLIVCLFIYVHCRARGCHVRRQALRKRDGEAAMTTTVIALSGSVFQWIERTPIRI